MRFGDAGRFITSDEFLHHPDSARASELVRGEIRVVTPASGVHGIVAAAIFRAIDRFVEDRGLGICFADNTGFALPGVPNTVRSPDAAFIREDRSPPGGIGPGWVTVAPDLVVEIVSSNETAEQLEEKLRDYRMAGTTLAWVIDPRARTVSVRSSSAPPRVLSNEEVLEGEPVLPGFEIPVRTLFERLAR